MNINLKEIEVGDAFSEGAHYVVKEIQKDTIVFKHLESGENVSLSNNYVTKILKTANQYDKEVSVGLEDKYYTKKKIEDQVKKGILAADHTVKEGDLEQEGIRTIFEKINGDQVFTVAFKKADRKKTAKEFKAQRDAQIEEAVAEIEATAKAKKGVAEISKLVAKRIQDNPILPFEDGEERILTGYKLQFKSRDGRYDCKDLQFPDGEDGENIRPVNLNTLTWIVFDGVRYVLEKK